MSAMAAGTAATPVLDVSKEAIARRAMLREFSIQDRALDLHLEGSSNRDVGRELRVSTDEARRLTASASQRRSCLARAVPHPDPDSLRLTTPETLLLKSLLEVHLEQWNGRAVSSPDTSWIGRRVRRSSGWAVSCARRRIAVGSAASEDDAPDLVKCTGNGYMLLTDAGWGVAAALWPGMLEDLSGSPGTERIEPSESLTGSTTMRQDEGEARC